MFFTQDSNSQSEYGFSTPLKIRLVAYFRTHYDLDIKDEEVDLFLRSLGVVYDCLSRNPALTRPAAPTPSSEGWRGPGEALPLEEGTDLIKY